MWMVDPRKKKREKKKKERRAANWELVTDFVTDGCLLPLIFTRPGQRSCSYRVPT